MTDAGDKKAEASPSAGDAGDKKADGASDKKATQLEAPLGPIETPPEDFRAYDDSLLDQILSVSNKLDLSPHKDKVDRPTIEWESLGEKEGVVMSYAKMPGSEILLFKGVGVIPASVQLVEEAMRVIDNMKVIDPMCRETKLIRTFDKDHHIYYANFNLGAPMVWDRDFSWWSVDYNLKDGTYVTLGKSIITPDVPENKKRVRGEIRASGYVVCPIPNEPNKCEVTYLVQTDPKGWLPVWVVNYSARSQAFNPGVLKSKVPWFMEQREKRLAALKAGGGDASASAGASAGAGESVEGAPTFHVDEPAAEAAAAEVPAASS